MKRYIKNWLGYAELSDGDFVKHSDYVKLEELCAMYKADYVALYKDYSKALGDNLIDALDTNWYKFLFTVSLVINMFLIVGILYK